MKKFYYEKIAARALSEEKGRQIYELLSGATTKSPFWTKEQLNNELLKPDVTCLLAQKGYELAGVILCQKVADELEITNFAVKKELQGHGIGKAMLEEFVTFDKKILLEVRISNVKARRMYSKAGFKEIGRRKNYYREPLEDGVLMVRNQKEEK